MKKSFTGFYVLFTIQASPVNKISLTFLVRLTFLLFN